MSEAMEELMKRREEARLKYAPLPPRALEEAKESGGLCIYLPKRRETSKLLVLSDEAAGELLAASFEKWRAMAGYRALWSPELGTIECAFLHLRRGKEGGAGEAAGERESGRPPGSSGEKDIRYSQQDRAYKGR
jgi:hypothetical protein